MPDKLTEYMTTMRNFYQTSKTGWSHVREDYRLDARYSSGDPSDQWGSDIKSDRDSEGIPALTFDRLTPMAMALVNNTRKNRPQPQVMAGDDGDPQIAEIIEGKMRHLQYISRAEIAYSHAELCAIIGGWGFYEIEKDYVNKSPRANGSMSYDKEPRVRRILDPMCSFPDPSVQMPDFSDAERWIIRYFYSRDRFRQKFGVEPISWPFEEQNSDLDAWGNAKGVWIAKYYWIERKNHKRIMLWDGTEGRQDDLESDPDLEQYKTDDGHFPPEYINAERDEEETIVHCDIVDGEKILEENIVNADYIPVIAVTGTEVVSEGERRFISAIRYKRDPQKFLNASVSGVAEALGTANHAEYIAVAGSIRSKSWTDGKRHRVQEYYPKDILGNPAPPPQRDNFEPPIQSLTAAMSMAIDGVKGADGYSDNVTRPSQADISGVGVQRRQDQQNLANAHFEMNLIDAQWHGGRIMLQMLIRETDTPRKWQVRKEDGTQRTVAVVGGDTNAMVPGMENQPHYRVDQGEYGLDIETGPTYAAKAEQEIDTLLEILKNNPQMWVIYAPTVFKRLGFTDLEEIAQMAMPPQFQQAMQAKAQGVSPNELSLQNQVKQQQAVIQHIAQILQTKQIEQQGKLDVENTKIRGDISVEKLKLIRALIEGSESNRHAATVEMTGHRANAAEHLTDLTHQTMMAAAQPPEQQGAVQQ